VNLYNPAVIAPPSLLTEDLEKELYPGEAIVWTCKPPQSFFGRSLARYLSIGVALIVFGPWFMQIRPAVPRYLNMAFAVGMILLLIGFYTACVAPWIDWFRRRRTIFALTDRRALILERGHFLGMYFINEKLETELISHGDGTSSIRFGTPSLASGLGNGRKRQQILPKRTQLFSHIPHGAKLRAQIIEACDRPARDLSGTPDGLPFARRIDLEHQYDASAPAKMHPFEYAQPVRAKLLTGEISQYVGRPPLGFLFRWQDWFYIPFAAVWTILSLNFVWSVLRTGCPAIIGMGFVTVGFYMLIGRFIQDRRERARTWYTVTDRRCLIVIDGKIIETKSLYWHFIQGLVRRQHADRTATLFFELSASGRDDTIPETGLTATRHPQGIYFERIEDPKRVEKIVFEKCASHLPASAPPAASPAR
jgi:hypothetical protein